MLQAKLKRAFQVLPNQKFVSVALLVIRIVAGAAFVIHGFGKIQSPLGWMGPEAKVPGFFQLLAAISEFGGGIAWILGLLMPLASLGILCTMTVATLTMIFAFKAPFVSPTGGPAFELPLVFWCISLLFLLAGPGNFSLDRKVFGERQGL